MLVDPKIGKVFRKELVLKLSRLRLSGFDIFCNSDGEYFSFRLKLGQIRQEQQAKFRRKLQSKLQAKVQAENLLPSLKMQGPEIYLEHQEALDEICYYKFEKLVEQLGLIAKEYCKIFADDEEVLFVHYF